ncbi:MAG: WYL domain-containing protein [Actinobacteria bacterium]|nr:WYL domain-containing protein [Actinomycetota bacterium]
MESKLKRLMNLVTALLHAEWPRTRDELRAGLREYYPDDDESFRRQFERDKDELRSMGIPLVTAPSPDYDPPVTGYRIDRSRYRGRAPDLTPDELAALHLANSLVRLGGSPDAGPFWKLGGRPDNADVAAVARLPEEPALQILMDAVAERRTATFTYHGVERVVEPHLLAFRNGRWHIKGQDRTRGGQRQFRVDRLESEVAVGGPSDFDRPKRVSKVEDRPAWRYGDDDPVTALLLVDAAHAPWVTGHLGESAVVETMTDGSVVVAEEVCNREAFRSFVLTFLDGAEILGPAELRDDIVAWLRKMACPS